jgi:hypothetical protein
MKYFFFDRLKYKTEDANKYYKKFYMMQILNNFMCAIGSSFIALLFTYPFDLAYTRQTAKLVSDGNYKDFRSSFHTRIEYLIYNDFNLKKILDKKIEYNNQVFRYKYYEKFPIAILSSGISTFFNMLGFSLIRKQLEKDSNKSSSSYLYDFIKTLGLTSTLSIIISPIVYPFDSFLKQMQVDGARGYMKKYENNEDALRYFKDRILVFSKEFHRYIIIIFIIFIFIIFIYFFFNFSLILIN